MPSKSIRTPPQRDRVTLRDEKAFPPVRGWKDKCGSIAHTLSNADHTRTSFLSVTVQKFNNSNQRRSERVLLLRSCASGRVTLPADYLRTSSPAGPVSVRRHQARCALNSQQAQTLPVPGELSNATETNEQVRRGGSRPEGLSASGSGVPSRNRAGGVFQARVWLGSQEEMLEGHEVKVLVEGMGDQQQASTGSFSYLLYVLGHSG